MTASSRQIQLPPVSQSVPVHLVESSLAEPSHLAQDHSQPAEGEAQHGVPEVEIAAIHATGLTLALRCIPAGFYVTAQADGDKWQATDKAIHVGLDVLQWN